MCGIVGYVGGRDAVPVIVEGLARLEYRGYDSAGVAVVRDGVLFRRRAAGKLKNLEDALRAEPLHGTYALGHTRWATHGRPTEENAHPHQDGQGRIVVVHNGIIENYLDLKASLQAAGHRFSTQTDTEVIAHLVAHHYHGSLEEAVRKAVREFRGIYAIVLLHKDEPQKLVGARRGPPLVVGLGEGEHFLASDVPALLPYTQDFLFLDDGDVVTVTPRSVVVTDPRGAVRAQKPQRIAWDPVQAEKGGYRHFMLKEIHEQPRAVRDTLLLAICNVPGSLLTREAAGSLLTHAGPEIGVASTKAFTAQLVALSLLALHLGRLKGTVSREEGRGHLARLTRIPQLMEQTLAAARAVEDLTPSLMPARDFLYLGRGIHYPIALEGALKLKEISYVHAEGYPAGEMKHGPIALIDESMVVVALCPEGRVYEKMLGNVQEVKARGGRVVAVVSGPDPRVRSLLDPARDAVLELPSEDALWSPLLVVLPLQLLAYHLAVRAGRDV